MRQIRSIAVVLSLLTLTLLSGSALADTVKMTFTGPGGNNSGGVYTYPYNFSINGGPSTPLICDTFDNDVTTGETWSATTSSLLSGSGLFGSSANYKAAGIIFNSILAGTTNASDGNWAIWALFSSTALNSSFFQGDANALSIYNAALAGAPGADASLFANLVLFTPIAGSQTLNGLTWGGLPQEYIGVIPTPEPGQFAMMGMAGIVLLAAFAFRKRLGLELALARSSA